MVSGLGVSGILWLRVPRSKAEDVRVEGFAV